MYIHVTDTWSFYTRTSLSIWLHDWIACLAVLVYNKPSLVEIMQIDCSSFEWRLYQSVCFLLNILTRFLLNILTRVIIKSLWFAMNRLITLQEENIHRNLNYAISLKSNSLNLNSAYYYIFRNLSMIAFIIEIQKSKFVNIELRKFDQSEPSCQNIFCVYFHPVG